MSILKKAEAIVNSKARDYGDPVDNMNKIAKLATILTGKTLTDSDICKVQIALKLTREINKHKEDNLVDLVGYTEILNKLGRKDV